MKYKDKVKVYKVTRLSQEKLDCLGIEGVKDFELFYGTIEDVRTYAKNQWSPALLTEDFKHCFVDEEEYYMYLDDDHNLDIHMEFWLGLNVQVICEVPIEDFIENPLL